MTEHVLEHETKEHLQGNETPFRLIPGKGIIDVKILGKLKASICTVLCGAGGFCITRSALKRISRE